MKKLLASIVILAIVGVAVSGYALWQHFAPIGSGFCNVSARISCDLVNKSAHSEIIGVPISLLGIIGYAALAALAFTVRTISPLPPRKGEREGVGEVQRHRSQMLLSLLLTGALGGLTFSLYLTYIEFFVIGAICILCVASQAIILGITGLAAWAWGTTRTTIA